MKNEMKKNIDDRWFMNRIFWIIFLCILLIGIGFFLYWKNFSIRKHSNEKQSISNGNIKSSRDQKIKISIFQYKIEMAESLEELANIYEMIYPNIEIDVLTASGGYDYETMLKAKFASEEYPDIFNNTGDLVNWAASLEDLSEEPWVNRLMDGVANPITLDGKVYGIPLNIEAYGLIYNKDLFQQVGIKAAPKNFTELQEAAKRLKTNGIPPFDNGYSIWWVLGEHSFNMVLANQENVDDFIQGIKEGSIHLADNVVANQWIDFIDFTRAYEGTSSENYPEQLMKFAKGEVAMIQQGNWVQYQLEKLNPNLNIGLMPLLINDNNRLPVGVPNYWVVYKNSEVKEEAKAFLNWMVSSEVGKMYMIEKFKFIPPFKDIERDVTQLGPLVKDINFYINHDETLPWEFNRIPNNLSVMIADATRKYINGAINKEELFIEIEEIIKKI